MDMSGQLYTLASIPLGKETGTHSTGGWIGPTAGLDIWRREKYLVPCWELNDSCVVQPVALSLY